MHVNITSCPSPKLLASTCPYNTSKCKLVWFYAFLLHLTNEPQDFLTIIIFLIPYDHSGPRHFIMLIDLLKHILCILYALAFSIHVNKNTTRKHNYF